MTKRLENKVALITGAGSGIGAATALRFAEEGALVVLCGRRQEPLQSVAKEICAAGGCAEVLPLDAADEVAFTQALNDITEKHGRLDILVNNAYSMVGASIVDSSTADWRANFTVSLDATFFGIRAAMPLIARQGGAIVNISSVCGQLGAPYTAGYGAAKAGVLSLTRTAALEGAPANVRVNAVVPGVVLTPGAEAALPTEDAQRATAAGVPLRRLGDPREVANTILFLASDEASYITGVALNVDGGKTCELASGASMDAFEAS